MVDFSAIEAEFATAIGSTGYTTIEIGRIRKVIPVGGMPSLDISCDSHTSRVVGGYTEYRVRGQAVISLMGWDRTDNANAFKVLVEQVCAALETYSFTSFDALRELSSHSDSSDGEGTQVVRTVVIDFVCLAHG